METIVNDLVFRIKNSHGNKYITSRKDVLLFYSTNIIQTINQVFDSTLEFFHFLFRYSDNTDRFIDYINLEYHFLLIQSHPQAIQLLAQTHLLSFPSSSWRVYRYEHHVVSKQMYPQVLYSTLSCFYFVYCNSKFL